MPIKVDPLPQPVPNIKVNNNNQLSPLSNRKAATFSAPGPVPVATASRGARGTTSQQQHRQQILNILFLEERRRLQEQYELGIALQNHQMMRIRRSAAYKPNEVPYYLQKQHQQQYQVQQHTHNKHQRYLPPSLLKTQQPPSSLPPSQHPPSPSLLHNFPTQFATSINIGGTADASASATTTTNTSHGGGRRSTFSSNLKSSAGGNNDNNNTNRGDAAGFNNNPPRNIREKINRKRSAAGRRRRKEEESKNDNSNIDKRHRKRVPSDIASGDDGNSNNKIAKKMNIANNTFKPASSTSLYPDLQMVKNQKVHVQQHHQQLPATEHQTVQQIQQQREQQQLMNNYTGTKSIDITGNNDNDHHQNFHDDDDGAYNKNNRRFPAEKRILSNHFIPGTDTVVLGKGNVPKANKGNLKLKGLIMDNLIEYSNGERREKITVITKIIRHVRSKNGTNTNTTTTPTTGFVKYEDACWWEMTERDARVKVTALFRDCLHDQYRSSSTSKVRRRQQLRNHSDTDNNNNNINNSNTTNTNKTTADRDD